MYIFLFWTNRNKNSIWSKEFIKKAYNKYNAQLECFSKVESMTDTK